MANVSDMVNVPTSMVLGDKARKLRRLSIAEVFGQFEQEIQDEYVTRMQKIASTLVGKDKVDYLVQMSQAMPSGAELAQQAAGRTGTLAGIVKLFKQSLVPEADPKTGQPLPDPDIVMLLNESPDLVRQLSKAMVGIEAKTVKAEDSAGGPLRVVVPA